MLDVSTAADHFIEYHKNAAKLSMRSFWTSPEGVKIVNDYRNARELVDIAGFEIAVQFFRTVVDRTHDPSVIADLAEGPIVNFMWRFHLDSSGLSKLLPEGQPWKDIVAASARFEANNPFAN